MKIHKNFIICFILVLIILCSTAVFADDTVIFEDKVEDNIPFTISGIEHIARYYPSSHKTSITARDAGNEDRVLIEVEGCEEFLDMIYCVDDASYAFNDDTENYEGSTDLRVIEYGPVLEVEVSVDDSTPNLNQEVLVEATVTNTGNERASKVRFEHSFPREVRVSGQFYDPVTNSIITEFTLDNQHSKILKYKLTFDTPIELKSTAKAATIFNSKKKEAESNTISFETNTPFNISASVSPENADSGDDIVYTLKISNDDPQTNLVIDNVNIIVPENIDIVRYDMEFTRSGNTLSLEETIPPETIKEFTFKLTSEEKGQYLISGTANLRFGRESFSKEFPITVGVDMSDIVPSIAFSPEEVKAGRDISINAKVTNKGDTRITGLSLDIISDIIDDDSWRALEIEPGASYTAFNSEVTAPFSGQDKEFSVLLKGSYTKEDGSGREFELEKKLFVLDQPIPLMLVPEVTITEDRKIGTVKLNIKNIGGKNLTGVSIEDTLPKGFVLLNGSTSTTLSGFDTDTNLTSYSYAFSIHDSFSRDWFEIQHTVNAKDNDGEPFTYTKASKVLMYPDSTRDKKEEQTETSENQTNKADPPAKQKRIVERLEKKPGVFSKIWSWIKGIF